MPQSIPIEPDPPRSHRGSPDRRLATIEAPALATVLEVALFLRIAAALAVEWYVRRGGGDRVCMFPDAEYYWILAGTILDGRTYEIVEWADIPHFALRTPGYPLFLASCRAVLGDRPLGARLAQAVLGTLSVWLVHRLTRALTVGRAGQREGRAWDVPLAAALMAALHPYFLVTSALLLSEAVFVPLMLATLWGTAVLWERGARGEPSGTLGPLLLALAAGASAGAAVLVRPSWALFVPVMICGFLCSILRVPGRRLAGVAVACLLVAGTVAVMAPWWIRNARVLGRFVPTAVWMGASLYDGLNPAATGGSDMRFLADSEFWPLGELDQDRALARAAGAFARENPGRVLELAAIKLGKYWCPWPGAEGVRSWPLTLAGAAVAMPLFALMGLGLWERRRDARAWVLLAGPLLYFCAVHLVFASSMRYRIPAEAPAMGLAAGGLAWALGRAGNGARTGP
jgi:hypothetical protein